MCLQNNFDVVFTDKHIEDFNKFSQDCNPLHIDNLYASKTPFGERVVHGMATVCYALAKWDFKELIHLSVVKIKFVKPIYINHKYKLFIEYLPSESKVTMQIKRGDTIYTNISLTFLLRKSDIVYDSFKIINGEKICEYQCDREVLQTFLKNYDFKKCFIPENQLWFLAWSSYFVGVDAIGDQALYTQLSFQGDIALDSNVINVLSLEKHPRYNRVEIQGEGAGLRDFNIRAMMRPTNIVYSLDQISKFIPRSKRFQNKVVLITGANRGIGAILAKSLALEGAKLVLIYKLNDDSMEMVVKELMQIKVRPMVLKIDLSLPDANNVLVRKIVELNLKVDYIINNASPTIKAINFDEFTPELFMDEFSKFFSISLNTVFASKDILQSCGVFVNISTLFVSTPEASFTHYIAAKAALEGLIRALSIEMKETAFYNFRLPKVLTDQTNLSNTVIGIANPVDKISKITQYLYENKSEKKFANIDL